MFTTINIFKEDIMKFCDDRGHRVEFNPRYDDIFVNMLHKDILATILVKVCCAPNDIYQTPLIKAFEVPVDSGKYVLDSEIVNIKNSIDPNWETTIEVKEDIHKFDVKVRGTFYLKTGQVIEREHTVPCINEEEHDVVIKNFADMVDAGCKYIKEQNSFEGGCMNFAFLHVDVRQLAAFEIVEI